MTRLRRRIALLLRRWESGSATYAAISAFNRSVWRSINRKDSP